MTRVTEFLLGLAKFLCVALKAIPVGVITSVYHVTMGLDPFPFVTMLCTNRGIIDY